MIVIAVDRILLRRRLSEAVKEGLFASACSDDDGVPVADASMEVGSADALTPDSGMVGDGAAVCVPGDGAVATAELLVNGSAESGQGDRKVGLG